MIIADLDNAEAQATLRQVRDAWSSLFCYTSEELGLGESDALAFASFRDAWASVVFARTAEELGQATVRYQRAVVAYGQASRNWF